MTLVFRSCLLGVGLLHVLPASLVFFPDQLPNFYGIVPSDDNYVLLMRHRAVFFGLVGGLLLFAAITRQYESLAVTIGLLSMVSFIILSYWNGSDIHPALVRVRYIDIVATVLLALSWLGMRSFSSVVLEASVLSIPLTLCYL